MGSIDQFKAWLRAKYAAKIEVECGPVEASVIERLEILRRRMIAMGVASPEEMVGCTPEEVQRLEAELSVTLPAAYRWYLLNLGKSSGRLFTHDHMAVYYADVLRLTKEERKDLAAEPEKTLVDLPPDAIFIAGRLGEQFEFIRCSEANDSPVWYFNAWNKKIVQSRDSIVDWLIMFCDAAERAIARGYFKEYPHGTRP